MDLDPVQRHLLDRTDDEMRGLADAAVDQVLAQLVAW
jgi:hypothetical protein